MTTKPDPSKPLSSTSLPEDVSTKPDDRSTIPPEPAPVVGPNESPVDSFPASHPSAGHDSGLLEQHQTNEIPEGGYTGGNSVTGIDTRPLDERRVNRTGVTIEEQKEAEKRSEEAAAKAEKAAKERDDAKAKAAKEK